MESIFQRGCRDRKAALHEPTDGLNIGHEADNKCYVVVTINFLIADYFQRYNH